MPSKTKREYEQKMGRKEHREGFRSGAGAHDQTSRKKRSHEKAKLRNAIIDDFIENYDDDWEDI